MFEYLLILLALLVITLFLEQRFRVHLYHNLKERLELVTIFLVIGVVWDSYAIWRGHWVFPEGKNLGIKLGLMPLEEYLFILVIPYFILTIYKIINGKFRR